MNSLLMRVVIGLLMTVLATACVEGAPLAARYVRIDNPTAWAMTLQEIEVVSGGQNIVAKKSDWVTGTWRFIEGRKPAEPYQLVDTRKDTALRGPAAQTEDVGIVGAWIEIDLQQMTPLEQVIVYGSSFRSYTDKGHRVLSLLDENRRVVWATKWNAFDPKNKNLTFAFNLGVKNPTAIDGLVIPANSPMRVPMDWFFDVGAERVPADAAARMQRFQERFSKAGMAVLADEFFRLLEPGAPGLEEARQLYAKGEFAKALESWKRYWFSKMAKGNLHASFREAGLPSYPNQTEDLLHGLRVTIGPSKVGASRFTPGRIHWVDLPADPIALKDALADTALVALVNTVNGPLLDAYRATGDRRYLERWSDIMDDWAMNFFADADASRYNVKDLFVMTPADNWGKLMENLSNMAIERPEMIDFIPAATLARMQLVCLEQYGPAYWRQARETVFNHEATAIVRWTFTVPYIDEFRPGNRVARELRQHRERWMTLGSEPDGSMVEIGDEGHFSIPITMFGPTLKYLEKTAPDWFTPGWKNRAWEYYNGIYRYVFRHAAPGGYDHRFDHRLYAQRLTAPDNKHYFTNSNLPEALDPVPEILQMPEVRRIVAALSDLSEPPPAIDPKAPYWINARQKSRLDLREAADKLLGGERPQPPKINSDWMPYTGAYYFRGGWGSGNAFLAMMARNSRGGTEPNWGPNSWSYGTVYSHDYGFPLMRAETFTIDGLNQNTLGDKPTYIPGTKTSSLTYAERDPAPHRWHSSGRFGFGEAVFNGSYRNIGLKYEPGWLVEPNAGKLDIGEKCVNGVRANRQVHQLRDSRLFIVTDTAHFADAAERDKSHMYRMSLSLMLSTLEQGASQPFSPQQLAVDDKGRTLSTRNPDGANVALHQFADFPLRYGVGREAKPDFKEYAGEVTSNTGIAPQQVFADWQVKGDSALVTLIASSPRGVPSRVKKIESMNVGNEVSGFHAVMEDGNEIWYQASAGPVAELKCGRVSAKGESLLVTRAKTDAPLAGIAIGAESFAVSGKAVKLDKADFEFALTAADELNTEEIFRPIRNIRFTPDRNAFTNTIDVEMKCDTPGVEIRYTDDGTVPGRNSKLYTGPISLTQSTEFAARAYRLGKDGRQVPADDFEINGTKFTVPSYGWFYKKPLKQAVKVDEAKLSPGLVCEHLKGQWTRLYNQGHWLPATRTTVAEREMDLSSVKSDDYYGARFKGCIKVPEDGVYTFHAPPEYVFPDIAASYDLRVYVDGEEWYLTQWWHGHGTWSVPLAKGFHEFQVDFADARTTPWKKSDLWRFYPRPWVVYQGDPSPILVSGPGIEKTRIPAGWLWTLRLE